MNHRDMYTRIFLSSAGRSADENLIKQFRNIWWWNNRSKLDGGLRLTDAALQFITDEAKIKTYKIDFPAEFSITPQVLIWLDRFIDSPYFITKKNIVVLKERAAFELYLFSGDVKKMGHNKALSKRLSQELPQE